MNQLNVPISLRKIQLLKIYSLYGQRGKNVGRVFPVDLLFEHMKVSFSRAACNCVEKNGNLRQYNVLPSKNVLVAICDNRGKEKP